MARHEAFAWQRQARRLRPLDQRPSGAGRGEGDDRPGSAELAIAPVDVELAVETREALRTLATLKQRQRTTLALRSQLRLGPGRVA